MSHRSRAPYTCCKACYGVFMPTLR